VKKAALGSDKAPNRRATLADAGIDKNRAQEAQRLDLLINEEFISGDHAYPS
jgi:hypothetical protein